MAPAINEVARRHEEGRLSSLSRIGATDVKLELDTIITRCWSISIHPVASPSPTHANIRRHKNKQL
eukprot:scaffold147422_cov29-Prasinocladus_malaysianus.AAC.1